MTGITQEERTEVREMLSHIAVKAEEAVKKTFDALFEHNTELAEDVIEGDSEINDLEDAMDQHCITLLALKQPMARDLRLVTSAMKATTELERIADLASNISGKTCSSYGGNFPMEYKDDILKASEITQGMIRDSIESFVSRNKRLALKVILRDEEIDKLNRRIWKEAFLMMNSDKENVSKALILSYVSKNLERIADHAVHIAEMVIYMVEGRIVRHLPPEDIELE